MPRHTLQARMNLPATNRGFTLAELIVTIAVLGILAAVIVPRFAARDTFASRGFFDEATETVRYAQKISVAWRRQVFVCVGTAEIAVSLVATCPLNQRLIHPATGGELVAKPRNNVTLTGTSFSFIQPTANQVGGQPSTGAQVVITLNGVPGDPARRIVIERETGYVHN